ncbi:MAG: D-aminoacyl-tRNA deacylase [Candidatus Woesearchaeota archaeon]
MKYCLLFSRKDIASLNILDKISNYDVKDCIIDVVDVDLVSCERVDERINADIFVFASRHQSSSGKKCLLVHVPGNWGKADQGGEEKKLCVAPPLHMALALSFLKKYSNGRFEVTQECTHHGPYLKKPCFFIEIGSDESAWVLEEAGEVVAKSLQELILSKPKRMETAVGVGGPHYMPNFSKLSNVAFGHVCPKYLLSELTPIMLKQALENTCGGADSIYLDWKGMGTEKSRIVKMLENECINYKKI